MGVAELEALALHLGSSIVGCKMAHMHWNILTDNLLEEPLEVGVVAWVVVEGAWEVVEGAWEVMEVT